MRVIRKVALTILLTFLCLAFATGQDKQNINQLNQQDEHISRVIASLDKYNRLRMALEAGSRGDGVHHAWMDDMRKLGIKHVSFTFHFFSDQGSLRLDISEVIYLKKYYQFEVIDPEVLRQIVDSGLKDKLEVEAKMRATSQIQNSVKEFQAKALACGTAYEILLDDETLPILNGMSYIEIDSDCIPKKECQKQR